MSKIIYAPNIHCGGGRVLLDLLLKEVELNGGWFLIIDNRVKVKSNLVSGGWMEIDTSEDLKRAERF